MEEGPQTRSEKQSRVVYQAFLIAPHASRTLFLAVSVPANLVLARAER